MADAYSSLASCLLKTANSQDLTACFIIDIIFKDGIRATRPVGEIAFCVTVCRKSPLALSNATIANKIVLRSYVTCARLMEPQLSSCIARV
jgi:hypothetical protein